MTTKSKKLLTGRVVSDRMQKGVVIMIDYFQLDRKFKKTVRRSKKLMAHDAEDTAKKGDLVKVEEVNPMSKKKRYNLVEVVERAPVI